MLEAEIQQQHFAWIVLEEELDLHDVWLAYFSITGNASEDQVARYAVGLVMLPQRERDLLVLAVLQLVLR